MGDPLELRRRVEAEGRVTWIGVAPARRAPIELREAVEVAVGTGIVGEHHATGGRSARQVTLVQAEHLDVIARLLGREALDPALLRRNVVVAGVNLYALRDRRFRVGGALLEGSGFCHPCSRMEENLGHGGYQACRGHGGITAVVIEPGRVALGDAVRAEPALVPSEEAARE